MFFLLISLDTITGSLKNRDEIISDCTSGGADAVRAMNGASMSARNPPTSLNAFLKSVPLLTIVHYY